MGAGFLACLRFAFMIFLPVVVTILVTAFVFFLPSCCKHSYNCVLAFLFDFFQLACFFVILILNHSGNLLAYVLFFLFACLPNFCFLTFLLLWFKGFLQFAYLPISVPTSVHSCNLPAFLFVDLHQSLRCYASDTKTATKTQDNPKTQVPKSLNNYSS